MVITYWNGFSKRKNSTKRPATAGTDINVVLKEDTSREHPSFQLTGHNWSMNYVQAFGNYYYVEDIISLSNGISEIVCTLDPMATAKAEIGAVNAFVEYATNGNVLLADPRIPKKTYDIRTAQASQTLPFNTLSQGSFRIAIMGKTGCEIYSMTWTELNDFLTDAQTWVDDLFNYYPDPGLQSTTEEQIWSSGKYLVDVMGQFIKQITGSGKISENIRSCVWVPWALDGASVPLYVGQFYTGRTANHIIVQNDVQDTAVSIPWPAGVTDWRRVACVDVYLYLPFVGVVQLSPYTFSGFSTLFIKCSRSRTTGQLAYEVKAGSGTPAITIGTYGAETGCEFPVGVTSANLSQSITSVIAATAGIATGGAAGAAATMYGFGAFADSFIPQGGSVGGIGGSAGAGLDLDIKCITVYHPLTEDPGDSAAIHGIPLYEHRTISSLSGYVQCANASVQSALNETEKEIINGYLNSGFYYE